MGVVNLTRHVGALKMYCGDWEKTFLVSLCANAGSYSDMACIIIMTLHVCIMLQCANLVEVATDTVSIMEETPGGTWDTLVLGFVHVYAAYIS